MAIERIIPGTIEWEAFYANHIKRYQFAVSQIAIKKDQKILDAACGVGYGSFLLSSIKDSQIIAVDRSELALNIAGSSYCNNNIQYLTDDCHTLEKSKLYGPFDAIVSFETLENLPNPDEFLNQCFNNLQEGGRLIISTPNQIVSSIENLNKWEFHEKEYTPKEFYTILQKAGFLSIQLYGQELTSIGKLRKQFRSELNTILSNPFIRMGQFLQRIFKGHTFSTPLPEQLEDFDIVYYKNHLSIDTSVNGPFVLIAVCEK
jgi:2-polyprenyl-3-methyl-5-hydroxy-6-metoxy-1,4-benzoquinol methylase